MRFPQNLFRLPAPLRLGVPAWLDIKLCIYLLTTIGGVLGLGSSWAYWYYLTQATSEVIVDRETESTPRTMMLEVNGAVAQPGVYTLQYGDRVAQALQAAGGLLPDADASYVAKQLALAELVSDGQKIYIPFQEQVKSMAQVESSSTASVNLNTATASELEELPGVGAAKAKRIIELRPITSLSQLEDAKVLSADQTAKLQASVSL